MSLIYNNIICLDVILKNEKTNSALKAMCRVKHHLEWLKIKCHFPELQGLGYINNIVTACCSSAGRTACPAFAWSAHARRHQRAAIWYKETTFGVDIYVVLARPTCCWRSSGEYINAFICVQYFKHTQLPLRLHCAQNMRSVIVQRPPRTT